MRPWFVDLYRPTFGALGSSTLPPEFPETPRTPRVVPTYRSLFGATAIDAIELPLAIASLPDMNDQCVPPSVDL